MVVMCKNPNVRMSLLVPKDIWPLIVARIQTFDLKYHSEQILKTNENLVRINDISGTGTDIMNFLNNLEVFNTPAADGSVNKIYVLVTARRGKKHVVKENGEEAGGRSEDGTGVRPGSDSESGGTGDRPAVVGPDDVRQLEMFETGSANDDCD